MSIKGEELKPCSNTHCDRWIAKRQRYCCAPCAAADFGSLDHLKTVHTEACCKRHAQRGAVKWRKEGNAKNLKPRGQ